MVTYFVSTYGSFCSGEELEHIVSIQRLEKLKPSFFVFFRMLSRVSKYICARKDKAGKRKFEFRRLSGFDTEQDMEKLIVWNGELIVDNKF